MGALPETNIAPENVPLEEEIHLQTMNFLGFKMYFFLSFQGCVI